MFLQIYYRCLSIAFTNSSAACWVQFLLRQCRTVGQMIPRVFHSEMDPSNHKKSLVVKPGHRTGWCVWNVDATHLSVILNYGLEIWDKKHDHHYQPTDWTDCTIGAGFRWSDGCNRNLDRLMHPCTAIAVNGDSYRLKEHKLNKLLNQ